MCTRRARAFPTANPCALAETCGAARRDGAMRATETGERTRAEVGGVRRETVWLAVAEVLTRGSANAASAAAMPVLEWSSPAWERRGEAELLRLRARVQRLESGHRLSAGQPGAWSPSVQRWFDAAQSDFDGLDWHMRGWRPFAMRAVALDGRSFCALRPHLRDDPALARVALAQVLLLGARAHASRGCARPFVAALKSGEVQLPHCFVPQKRVEDALTRPSALAAALVSADPRGLLWLGAAVRDCPHSVRAAVRAARARGARPALAYASRRLRSCASFAEWAVGEDARSFAFLSPNLHSRRDLVELALRRGYGGALLFASPRHRHDADLLKLALRHGCSWRELPSSLDPLLLLESAQEEGRDVGVRLLLWLEHTRPRAAQFLLLVVRIWPDLLPLACRGQGPHFLRHAMLADPEAALRVDEQHGLAPQELGARLRACRADVLPRGVRRKLAEREGGDGHEARCVRRRVRGEMRCPVCLELVCRPVMQCRLGHLICRGCVEQLPRVGHRRARCPVCRCEHDEEQGFSRSLLADAILDELLPASPEEAPRASE